MLDSGAFSAWNSGGSIDLDRYIAFLKEHQHRLFSYATLDVLPEGRESARTVEATEQCAKASYRNHHKIKNAGLTPIPIFHQGESFKWLELMLKEGEPYIGIATRKDLPMRQTLPWLDKVWKLLRDDKGAPIVKTHGFGITAVSALWRYPWYTSDSTSWALGAGFGQIYVPIMGRDGQADYRSNPVSIITSGAERAVADHFDSFGPSVQHWVRSFVEGCGVSLSDVRNTAQGRMAVMLAYYTRLADAVRKARADDFQIMFATLYRHSHAHALKNAGVTTRLLSYYEIRDQDPERLVRYIETGSHSVKGLRRPGPNWNREAYLSHRRKALSDRSLKYDEEAAEIRT